MTYKVTISDGTVLSKCIDNVSFNVESSGNLNNWCTDPRNSMIIVGKIDTGESTATLYQWALIPVNNKDCYKNVTVEYYKNEQLVRKVCFNKAFVVDYSENYSNYIGVGTFTLHLRQFCGKEVECFSQTAKQESKEDSESFVTLEEVVEATKKVTIIENTQKDKSPQKANMSFTDRLEKQKKLQYNENAEKVCPELPAYDGKTTHGVFVTPNGEQIPFSSGNPNPFYKNYIPASHVEGKSAIYMREKGISRGVIYHNNTDGTCPYCDKMLSTLLEEGSVLEVIPPANSKAPKPSWVDKRKTYIGNDKIPKSNNK